jgi:ribosomal protein S18 acetylase RimI-like enzyme
VAKDYGVKGNLAMASILARFGGWQGVKNSLTIEKRLNAAHPRAPHHYLFAISVHPDHQGKGVGGTLMRAALAEIDRKPMPAYLENSKERNIPFYQSFGFRILEEIIPGKGCPPMWLMWRDAQ